MAKSNAERLLQRATKQKKAIREATKTKKKSSIFSRLKKALSGGNGGGNPYRDKKTGKFTSKK